MNLSNSVPATTNAEARPEAWSALASASSFLFVPATRPERFAKALASGAHAVIIDLEDAVAPADKVHARALLLEAFRQFDVRQRARLLVRMNASGTPWHEGELLLLRELTALGLGGVMVPKAETPAGLQHVARSVGSSCALLPLIESVAGLDAADALATAPQVLRLAFGHLDFQADAGLACGPDEAELLPVRLAVLLASRRAGLVAPIDGVTVDTQDVTRLQNDVARSRRGGFGAKLCIHPAQVAHVNAGFAPSEAELTWARRVQQGFEAAAGAVFSLDGRMVDAPVLRLARQTLERASRAEGPGA